MSRLGAAILLAGLAFAPRTARACGPCATGDPAITFGAFDRPVPDRVRLGASARTSGLRSRGLELSERRFAASLAWSPTDFATLIATVPFASRELRTQSLRVDQTWGLSDLEVAGRVVMLRDRSVAPELVLSIEAGLTMPTSIPLRRADGSAVPLEAQPGRGAWEPRASLVLSHHGEPVDVLAVLSLAVPLEGFGGERAGMAARATILATWQPAYVLSVVGGLEGRFDGPTMRGGVEISDTPLASVWSIFGLALRPSSHLTWLATVRVPLVEIARGEYEQGPSFELSIIVDA